MMGHGPREQEFLRSVRSAVSFSKRALLDFVDLQISQLPVEQQADPRVQAFFNIFKKRVHNDISMIDSKTAAAFEIYQNGGVMPIFGRTDEERKTRA